MKRRDRRLTPTSASLTAGWTEAVHREGTELRADTASEKTGSDTVSAEVVDRNVRSLNKPVLDGEGTSKDSKESMDTARLIPKNKNPEIIENTKTDKAKMNKTKTKVKVINKRPRRQSYRVPVQYPDGKPGMPTTNKRANKWLEEGKAEIVRNKLNVFAIKLKFWPIYRNLQPIVLLIDP